MILTLKGNPLSTQHIYRQRGVIKFMTKEGNEMKESYIKQAKEQWESAVISGDICLEVALFFGDKRKRDIDNFNKLWMDALSGIVYVDDVQIQVLILKKFYDKKNPRIEIKLLNI